MANSFATFKEMRFVFKDELTEVYVFVEASGDSPIGVQGWHHKTYPISMSTESIVSEWAQMGTDIILWPLKSPDMPRPLGGSAAT